MTSPAHLRAYYYQPHTAIFPGNMSWHPGKKQRGNWCPLPSALPTKGDKSPRSWGFPSQLLRQFLRQLLLQFQFQGLLTPPSPVSVPVLGSAHIPAPVPVSRSAHTPAPTSAEVSGSVPVQVSGSSESPHSKPHPKAHSHHIC